MRGQLVGRLAGPTEIVSSTYLVTGLRSRSFLWRVSKKLVDWARSRLGLASSAISMSQSVNSSGFELTKSNSTFDLFIIYIVK